MKKSQVKKKKSLSSYKYLFHIYILSYILLKLYPPFLYLKCIAYIHLSFYIYPPFWWWRTFIRCSFFLILKIVYYSFQMVLQHSLMVRTHSRCWFRAYITLHLILFCIHSNEKKTAKQKLYTPHDIILSQFFISHLHHHFSRTRIGRRRRCETPEQIIYQLADDEDLVHT